MKDTKFFECALELQHPWYVKKVRMDVAARKVEVEIECRGTVWVDPQSRQRAHIHGYERRRWRHLDTMQFETVLVAEVPRVKQPDGRTETVQVPWADRYTHFTRLRPPDPEESG